MLESISASRSLLVGDLLGGVSSLAGLGGNFLGLVGRGEIAFPTSLLGPPGGGPPQGYGKGGGTRTDLALRRQPRDRPTGSTGRLPPFLGRSSLEVFVDDGATVGSLLVFTAPSCQELVPGATRTATIPSGSLTPLAAAL